ncbi:AraC-like ligand binding domain-containing protein [Catalinimonas alkaloidigena]|uniref:AraC-like ligand binding domain-containing protein n=1 Tax=Catalinimonas alkaloidigena TaxID=1075417 RepID=A0A1G8YI86_9BACT|nr:AraC family transcriptional regulator [Catalinimonas alkaloidigena]SDK02599.1 AraC-like ligand binding domain-containing protein [Catalinimonas alkaloidigena]
MKRYKQFESLKVEDFELDRWTHPLHNHNHFELIYIARGRGTHHINGLGNPYQRGDLFLLGPEDEHEFRIEERTRFIYFKFTRLYLQDSADLQLPVHWNRDVDHLLWTTQTQMKKCSLLRSEHDTQLAENLMEMISAEYQRQALHHQRMIFQLFSLLITLIKRNHVPPGTPPAESAPSETSEMLDYIERHIYEPSQLTLKSLADHFHYSPHYFGILFKNQVGTTLRDYVGHYRLKLIEQRLRYSHDSLKQIAAEFGFFDESHLNKFFKKSHGQNPSDFRHRFQRVSQPATAE